MVDTEKISKEKEFYDLRPAKTINMPSNLISFNDYDFLRIPEIETLSLQGHQIFVKNLMNPHSHYKRLLLYHSTGTGKTIVILSLAQMYIQYFQKMKQQPQFTIIGFTEDIIVRELTKYIDFGYITVSEREELDRLRYSKNEQDILRRRGLKSTVKRRITDKTRGGYYKFFGYQKFANDIFIITTEGVANNINHNYLYEDENKFIKRVEEAVEKKYILVNRVLLESLKYGFIACDEIHNVYNARAKNNRGMAIEYVLRLLETEDSVSAPKVLYASATPLTGSPSEIVDLMNLLIPDKKFNRSEFFDKGDKFKPNALEQIGKICNGYVSFLKDTDVTQYPKRILVGESLFDIDYLKFTPCPMSKFQEDTLAEVKDKTVDISTLLATNTYTLYDIAFPSPNSSNIGLYNSSRIYNTIESAPEKWKERIGINVEGSNLITGDFLDDDNLGKYSEKYKELLEELTNLLDQKIPGKIIIYHYYVGASGVLLVKEMLLKNGFLDATSVPLSNTRCTICGLEQQHHKKEDHQFKPVRVLIAYGEIGSELDKTLSYFNDKSNIFGYEYRILIGSRVIHEGIDFNCVRFMYILSLPRDISTLIQVFGRSVRRRSHIMLPHEYRDVHIHTLVSTFKNKSKISPEMLNYKRKMEVYLKIQLVERELRRYAVDNFINYDKMDLPDKPTLDGLPYRPVFTFKDTKKIPNTEVTTFSAYGYSVIEEHEIIKILKKLFIYRAVWTESDLWHNVQHPFIEIKTAYDHSEFSKDNFILALDFLINSTYIENLNNLTLNNDVSSSYINIGDEPRRVIFQDPYYILCPTDELGIPIIDYDSFMRMDISEVDESISITKYVDNTVSEKNFKIIFDEYIKEYKNDPLLSLAKLHPNFHFTVMKQSIEDEIIKNTKELFELYEELNALVFYDDFLSSQVADSFGRMSKVKPVGFRAQDITFIFIDKKWQKISTTLLRLNKYTEEVWVGFSKLSTGDVEFKIRPGLDYLVQTTDRRKMDRGRTCKTLHSNVINKIAKFLSIDVKRTKTACSKILVKMMNIQRKEINKGKGKRVYYFFFEPTPYI